MLKEIRFVGLAAICALACGARVDAQAVQSPAASVHTRQIAPARSVFIMNEGSENREEKAGAVFSGGPDCAYNEFYAAMKDWGRFRLVPAPGGSDLIVEIQYVLRPRWMDTTAGEERACEKRNPVCKDQPFMCNCRGNYFKAPQLDLIVRDGETHAVLRTFNRLIEVEKLSGRKNKGNSRQSELDLMFDGAMNGLISDFDHLSPSGKASVPVYSSDFGVAPTPLQITQARKVWIARARPDSGRLDTMDMDPTSSDLAYNTFYALIKDGGRFEIADSPAAADLILQISTNTDETISVPYAIRRINLTVVDPKTGTGLWAMMQDAAKALLPQNARRNEQQSVADVAYKLTGLAGRITSTSVPKTIDQAPPTVLFIARLKGFIADRAGHISRPKPGDRDQVHNHFYADMQKRGRVELVSAPGLGNMIFELSLAGRRPNLHIVATPTPTAPPAL